MDYLKFKELMHSDEIRHYGIPGQRWGVRRFQNPDGSPTLAGRRKANKDSLKSGKITKDQYKAESKAIRKEKTLKVAKTKTSSLIAGAVGGMLISSIGAGIKIKGIEAGNKALSNIGSGVMLAGGVLALGSSVQAGRKQQATKDYVNKYN